jgi:hypothetical protein
MFPKLIYNVTTITYSCKLKITLDTVFNLNNIAILKEATVNIAYIFL